MKDYAEGSIDERIQTAVMSALPHATHPMHGDWRTKADVLIESLRLDGFEIIPVAAGLVGEPEQPKDEPTVVCGQKFGIGANGHVDYPDDDPHPPYVCNGPKGHPRNHQNMPRRDMWVNYIETGDPHLAAAETPDEQL